jgi:hypothetical protein
VVFRRIRKEGVVFSVISGCLALSILLVLGQHVEEGEKKREREGLFCFQYREYGACLDMGD